MTGYGRSDEHNDHLVLTVEIRTINSRFLDFSPRLPKSLLPFEDEAYKIVKKRCERGRVSLTAKVEYLPGEKTGLTLNQDKLEEYMLVVKDIQKSSDRDDFPSMGDILRLPDIVVNGDQKDENELKTVFLSVLNKTISEVEVNRLSEGKNIKTDLSMRLELLIGLVGKIRKKTLSDRDDNMERFKQKIQVLVEDINLDESRLYQEIAILAEKKDITEELVRLDSHIDLFTKYMNSKDSKGKKLNFLLQEMGREINTIGSKTDEIEISHLAVDMKDELEKIREQVQNIV
ncbi:YicC family protein [Candidatus Marinimicrobia bacterium PRS2]|nr:YicC family protein [Candidatus Marinimicrobia bacterium PRS2]